LTLIEKKNRNVNRWKNAKALVIGEISMIDGEFFDQLNYVANNLRHPSNGKGVWGGFQLGICTKLLLIHWTKTCINT